MNSLASFPEGQSGTVARTCLSNEEIVDSGWGETWPPPDREISTVTGSIGWNPVVPPEK